MRIAIPFLAVLLASVPAWGGQLDPFTNAGVNGVLDAGEQVAAPDMNNILDEHNDTDLGLNALLETDTCRVPPCPLADDTVDTSAIEDAAVTAAKVAPDVATQGELDAVAAKQMTTSTTRAVPRAAGATGVLENTGVLIGDDDSLEAPGGIKGTGTGPTALCLRNLADTESLECGWGVSGWQCVTDTNPGVVCGDDI